MDASDLGLCAHFPARREFVQLRFDSEETAEVSRFKTDGSSDYGINLRELMSAVFAAFAWASHWTPASDDAADTHVRFWIDNQSAVSWSNKRTSRNGHAQLLLRVLALCEVRFRFYCSAQHIAGSANVMADAGSRVWQSDAHAATFTDLFLGWLQAGALAASSHAAYSRPWVQWERWCAFMEYIVWLPRSDPVTATNRLGAFAVYLWRYGMNQFSIGNSYSTICAKLSAVKWYHRRHLGYDPVVDTRHALLLRGIRRFSEPVKKRLPLTPSLLRRIHSQRDLRQPADQLLWGGMLLAYFFLLRRSEYLQVGHEYHEYALRLRDIILLDRHGEHTRPRQAQVVGISLHGAKNNQYGREETRYMHKSGDTCICPVAGARWVLKAAAVIGTQPQQAALSTSLSRGVSAEQVNAAIRTAAVSNGLDPARFSTHSLRIGGATKLLNAGADRLVIKLLGRWASGVFEGYPVLEAEGTRGLSALMCG